MKVTISTKDLAAGVKLAKQAISTRSSLPILAGVLIDATVADYVTLRSTDLELALSVVAPAKIHEAGQTVIDHRALTNALAGIDAANVEFVTGDGQATIREPGATVELRTMAAEDFPAVPTFDTTARMAVYDVSTFARLAKETLAAASTDETRPVITGVLFREELGSLRMVATDSYRLHARLMSEGLGVEDNFGALLPGRTLKAACSLFGTKKQLPECVTITRGENAAAFAFVTGDGLGVHLTTRIIKAQFPNYEQLLPDSSATSATVERETLLAATKKAGRFALHSSPVRMELNGSGKLRAASQDVGGICVDFAADVDNGSMPCPRTNPGEENHDADCERCNGSGSVPYEMALNAAFLEDALKTLDAERVKIEAITPTKPAIIRDADNGQNYALIMPVRIS